MNTKNNFKLQVLKSHYYNEYDDLNRFISYYYQINLIKQLKPDSILEIGIGNKTVSTYLKQGGSNIETCDFDKTLDPDYVADIRDLPFKSNSYDLIYACEILEHIPWEDVDKALNELRRVSKKFVILSLPYASSTFEIVLKFPFMGRFFNKQFLNLFFRIPIRFRDVKFIDEHYWEIGRKSFSLYRVRNQLKKHFKIIKEVRPILNSYHYFFILEKEK